MHLACKLSLYALVLAGTPAMAAEQAMPAPGTPKARFVASADNTRITLAGTVVSASPDAFILDIGRDDLTVEMDDWDWFKEGRVLKKGDIVVVTGRIDQDLWESKKIEASSVYVKNLGTTFYASGADEEDFPSAMALMNPVTSASGIVTAVEGQEFTIGGTTGPVKVDMTKLSVRPALKVGQRVYAWGNLDVDPREKIELMANGVAVLAQDATKQSMR